MPDTPLGISYPSPGDPPDGPAQMQTMALDIDGLLGAKFLSGTLTGTTDGAGRAFVPHGGMTVHAAVGGSAQGYNLTVAWDSSYGAAPGYVAFLLMAANTGTPQAGMAYTIAYVIAGTP